MTAPLVRRLLQSIAAPASGATASERARVRALLSVGTAVLVLIFGLFAPRSTLDVNVEILWAVGAGMLGASSLVPRTHGVWDRGGGLIAVTMIALLVAGTGGITSRYQLLYLLNGAFGAAYYPRPRMLAETGLTVVALSAPVLYDAFGGSVGVGRTAIIVVVYVGVVTFIAWIVDRLRNAEERRAQLEGQYESAFEASPLPILTMNAQGDILEVNPAFERWSGYAAGTVVGTSFLDYVAPRDLPDARRAAKEADYPDSTRISVLDAHGRRRAVTATTLPLRSGTRRTGVWTILRDVTGEASPTESLRASEERYRRLVQNLPAALYLAPPKYFRGEDPLWYMSPRIEEWLGYPVRAWLSDPDHWRRVIHPDDHEVVMRVAMRAQKEHEPHRLEYRMIAADGSEYWVLDESHIVPGIDDEPGWVQGLLLDITEEKNTQRHLAEREHIQRTLAAYASSTVAAANVRTIAQRTLEAACSLTGAAAATIYNHSGTELLPLADHGWPARERPRPIPVEKPSAVTRALGGEIGEFDASGPLAEQGFSAGLAVPVPRRAEAAAVLAIHDTEPRTYSPLHRDALRILAGFLTETLDRLQTLVDLQESEARATSHAERLQTLIDASPLPIVELDADVAIVRHNTTAEDLLGLRQSHVGTPLVDALPHMAHELEGLMAQVTHHARPGPVEVTHPPSEQDRRILQVHGAPRSREGDSDAVVLFFVDVTEHRRLEAHMTHMEKMEALGRLAGGVAHDVNNLIAIIRSHAEMALHVEDAASLEEHLEGITAVADEGAELVSSLLGIASEDAPLDGPIDLEEAIVRDHQLYDRLLPPGVELRVEARTELPPVLIAPTHLRRILINLLSNAADALEGNSGRVEIALSSDGDTVTVAVCDEGVGIDDATASRVFEPFFTTHAGRGGTGLGLFIVYRLVDGYGGSVDIDSNPGQGTEVRLTFPAATTAA